MTFDDRNSSWVGNPRTFSQFNSRASSPRVWSIEVSGNIITYSWGQMGGAIQTAQEICQGVNIGKSNEVSPEAYALYVAREKCRKQNLSGYRETDQSGNPMDPLVSTSIDFDNLPPSLCFYKPDNTLGAKLEKKAREGRAWFSRKRNGLAFIISKGTQYPKLYSRRMLRQHDDELGSPLTWDDRFPHILEEANKIMPENSILLGELVMDREGRDDFAHVQSITKSLTHQSQQDQALGRPSFYIWDIAFWAGQDMLSTSPVSARYELIHEIGNSLLMPVEFVTADFFGDPSTSVEKAVEFAKQHKFEGWVVVDPDGIYGDKGYNFKGKPDRPGLFCGKLKPEWEIDAVAMWDPANGVGEISSKGRYSVNGRPGIKSVALYQYDRHGQLVFLSNCSSGMTEAMKQSMADPAMWPRVWEVAYSGRRYMSDGDDTNALDFPRFVRERPDKLVGECVDDKL